MRRHQFGIFGQNDAKMEAVWAPSGRVEHHFGIALSVWTPFGCHFEVRRLLVHNISEKSVIFIFQCHSQAELLLLQVQTAKLDLLGPNSHARMAHSDFEVAPGHARAVISSVQPSRYGDPCAGAVFSRCCRGVSTSAVSEPSGEPTI